jgi:DNA-binding IclR family transcriptional regulator
MTRISTVEAAAALASDLSAAPVAPAVESVRRALRILRCFSLDDPELGVSEIARRLEMHKSTVHRLIATLEMEGFVHQVGGNRYALGWKLFELGEAVRGLYSTRDAILRHLRHLVDATGETAHLAVLDEGDVLYIEKVESSRPLRMPSSVGKRIPPHCTALGKVFLAGLSEPDLWKYVYRPLQRFTPNTITDPDRLRSEVEMVRDQGFAVDHEEIEEGLMCIAGPIVDDRAAVCAAVSIAGPASRIGHRQSEFVVAVTSACAALSAELGAKARHLSELATPPSAMGRQ